MDGLFSGVLTMLAAGVAAPAIVEDAPPRTSTQFSLSWSGDAHCHPTDDVVEGVRRYVGGPPESVLVAPLVVQAHVEANANHDGLTLTLIASGPRGPMKRELAVANCNDVASATSLVLSLWIQAAQQSAQTLALESSVTTPDVPSDVPAAVAPVVQLQTTSNDMTRDESRLRVRRVAWTSVLARRTRLQFAGGAIALGGPLPRLGVGMLGRVGVFYGAWHADALLVWLNTQEQRSFAHPSIGGAFGFSALGIRVARHLVLTERLNIQPGLWTIVGRLAASSLGTVARSTPADGDWGAVGLGLDAELRWGPVRFDVGAGGGLPFGRPRFTLGDEHLYRTSAWAAFAQSTLGTVFP
jgi:hypothetical protein